MITKIAYVTRAKMGMKVTGKRMYKSSQLIFLSLLSKYFDLPSSRPASLDEFMQRRKYVISGKEHDGMRNNLCNDADEFGYLPTGETLSDIEAMLYIHQMAEKLKKEGHL